MDDLFHSAPERANFEGKKVTSDTHFNNKKIFKETVMLIDPEGETPSLRRQTRPCSGRPGYF